jgi:hypothetical protein
LNAVSARIGDKWLRIHNAVELQHEATRTRGSREEREAMKDAFGNECDGNGRLMSYYEPSKPVESGEVSPPAQIKDKCRQKRGSMKLWILAILGITIALMLRDLVYLLAGKLWKLAILPAWEIFKPRPGGKLWHIVRAIKTFKSA